VQDWKVVVAGPDNGQYPVQALEKDIRAWVIVWNTDPKPFVWTKTAEQILGSIGRLIQRINGAAH
jgi:hypothetical protein